MLETSLTNFNAVMHPPGMVMNAGWIEFTKGNFSYYCEGTTPAVARVIEEIDKERMALVLRSWLLDPSLFSTSFTKPVPQARKGSSRIRVLALQESEPNRFIRAPANLSYRFLTEDIPYGIVPMAYLGKMLACPTPTINALMILLHLISQTNYWATGWTPEKMGIDGMGLKELLDYVENG